MQAPSDLPWGEEETVMDGMQPVCMGREIG